MGGSGGGQAGMVVLPKSVAATLLGWISSDAGYEDPTASSTFLTADMTDTMDAAIGYSPFLGEVAYDSSTRISNWETEIGAFETIVDALHVKLDWDSILTQAVTSIEEHWNTYTIAAHTNIMGASGWIDPSHTSFTNIKADWLDPNPVAHTNIKADWIDPSPAAYTNIKGNWVDPSPAAAGEISADVDAFEAIVDDRVENTVLARFQRGMQDINGVMTSAFTIGQAIIEGMADRDIAKYQGELRTKAYLLKDQLVATGKLEESKALAVAYDLNDQLLAQGKVEESKALATAYNSSDQLIAQSKLGESNRIADAYIEVDRQDADSERGESDARALAYMQADRLNADNVKGSNLAFLHSVEEMIKYFMVKTNAEVSLTQMTLRAEAMALEAERTEAEDQREIDEADAKWDLSVFQYGANLLAAASGGALIPPPKTGPSRMQATIGGAAGGAAMGAQAMPGPYAGYGAIGGAVVGAYLGYSQS